MSHSIKAQITVISVQKKKIIPKGACIVEEVSKYEYLSYLINLPDFYQYVLPVKYSFCEFVVKVQKNEKQERQKYHLYYDAEQKYLMSAKKEKNNIGCNYSICTQKNPSKDQGFIAKLRGNFRSNQFNLYDNGKNPDKNLQPKRMQLCFIKFTDKSLWKDDPNNIVMTIPKPMLILSSIKNIPQSQNDQRQQQQSILAQRNQVSPKKYQPKKIIPEHSRSNLLQQLNQKNSKQVQVIKNKKPQFNAKKNQYELNFKGLIEQASSLNYILHTSAGMTCLVSGKRTENTYSIYIGFPMTILQGFAFFLANLENKSS